MRQVSFECGAFALIVLAALLPNDVANAQSPEPWETPRGRACIDRWAAVAAAKLNAYQGTAEHNGRKAWNFHPQYGTLQGNPRTGPTSFNAPDNFVDYGYNKHWYMYASWTPAGPSGTWTYPAWNGAAVESIQSYVPKCLGAPLGSPAAMGAAAHAELMRRGPTDATEVEAFVDGVMAASLADKKVAGAVVSVVRDGGLLFAKGYGYADVKTRKPVDPENTLFRIGSVSKLFTWTAVMQLVERGKLDLDADVNGYLDFEIPATFEQPITLRHLLTHTPGLEEDSRDLFTKDPKHLEPMGKWLPSHMPARVRPPGVFSSYSNWGTALAGYIVERVSGQTYDEYLEEHILRPLGSSQITARQPLPAALEPHMSTGYAWKGGGYVAKEFEIITGAAPAGSISASATAMARFMLAHLNQGELAGQRILTDETAAQMHSRAFTHDPRLNGFCLGFYEKSAHGVRIVGHGGDTQWFHTDLALFPEEQLGVFVSFNTATGATLSFGPFLTAFLDHYYPVALPVAPPVVAPAATKAEDLERFKGSYLFNRMSSTTFQKALGLAAPIPIRVGPESTLILSSPFGELQLVQLEPLLWQEVHGGPRVAFRADDSGRISHAFLDIAPMMTLERWGGLRSPNLHRAILGGGLVLFVAFLIAALARFLRQRRGEGMPVAPPLRSGRRFMGLAALCFLLFVAAVAALASKPELLLSDAPIFLQAALVLPILGGLFVLGAGWHALRVWSQSAGRAWERVRFTATVAIGLAFVWSLQFWNLLGWRM